jgi:3-methyl-2-oxobutanoate hydroxymethyltransferase
MRGAQRACVVVDLPFGSYQASPAAAFDAAARVISETGCAAVKLEGGAVMAETVAFLVARGIPVMGHVGLMPQSVRLQGGFRTQGRAAGEAEQIARDARAIEQAGAFSLVVEGIMEPLARRITEDVQIPTIGIGASPRCDGQVLVGDDLLGIYTEFTPKFVKRYAEIGKVIGQAAAAYAEEVRARQFPGPEHYYLPKAKS